MPLPVSCACGMQFQAEDHLAGKQLQCRNCGGPLAILIPNLNSQNSTQASAAGSGQQGVINVQCGCGAKFMAAARLAGTDANCPNCSATLSIPLANSAPVQNSDPLGAFSSPLESTSALGASSPLQSNLGGGSQTSGGSGARAKKPSQSSMVVPAAIGGIVAVVLLAVVGLFLAGVFFGDDKPEGGGDLARVDDDPSERKQGDSNSAESGSAQTGGPASVEPSGNAASTIQPGGAQPEPNRPTAGAPPIGPTGGSLKGLGGLRSPPSGGLAGDGSASPGGGLAANPLGGPKNTGETASATETNLTGQSSNASSGPHRLFVASQKWLGSGQVKGIHTVMEDRPLMVQYSWMTALLPHLGHQKLHGRIDQTKPWLDERNLAFSAAVIPQFQNPSDDRKVWKGYPFDGMGLSHFVGMAGVEDRRTVVAGELPRSDPRAGVFGYDKVAKRSDITDGESQTILLIGAGKIASPWVQGGGATIRGAREPYFDKLTGFGSVGNESKPGSAATMVDGSVRFLSSHIDPQVMRALCTIHGAETVDVSQAGEPLTTFKVGEGPALVPRTRTSKTTGRR